MIKDGRAHNYGLYFGTNGFDNDGDAVHDGIMYTGNGVDGTGLEGVVSGTYTWSATPYPTVGVWQDASPEAAYERVLREFGATPWQRDEVDQLLFEHVTQRTGDLIERESDLIGIGDSGFGTLASGVAATDSDRDGMPDDWEVKHGTNPLVPNNNADFDFDGYTDLEEYLNDIAAFPATGALGFTGIGRYADWQRWSRHWQPSRFDEAYVHDGAAFVDAVGQLAGTLRLGTQSGGHARMYVTSGWLEVSEELIIGDEGTGQLDLYGGEVRILDGTLNIHNGALRMFGGKLETASIEVGPDGDIEFSGGELAFDELNHDLVNDGGTLRVGRGGVSSSVLIGNLTLNHGSLAIDLSAAGASDLLIVTGDVMLGGSLDVSLLDGFEPQNGQAWPFLLAASGGISGTFDSITDGFSVEQRGTEMWLLAANVTVPEPATITLLLVGIIVACTRRRSRDVLSMSLLVLCASVPVTAATILPVIADAQLNENGTTGLGDAVSSGNGTGSTLNARWLYEGATPNRNEWIALKFDLGDYPDKSRLTNIGLRTYMHRASPNNTKPLRLFALTPGTSGEDWDESTIEYATMPGFTFDGFSTTNILDVGGTVQDLGAFQVSGVEGEGSLALIELAPLTDLVRNMGTHDLLTLLISYDASSNGQWRVMSREATMSDTGVLTGLAGDFAPFLDFTVASTGVLGDYNDNGIVDSADFTVWRNRLGETFLTNEGVSPNVVDIADYLYWVERFGATDSGEPSSGVLPEPAGLQLGWMAVAVLGLIWRNHSRASSRLRLPAICCAKRQDGLASRARQKCESH